MDVAGRFCLPAGLALKGRRRAAALVKRDCPGGEQRTELGSPVRQAGGSLRNGFAQVQRHGRVRDGEVSHGQSLTEAPRLPLKRNGVQGA